MIEFTSSCRVERAAGIGLSDAWYEVSPDGKRFLMLTTSGNVIDYDVIRECIKEDAELAR